jgi:large subunit ribosomal protein L25
LQTFDLRASQRKGTGKGAARALRRQGLIPAVLYGPATASIALSVSAMDLERIYGESGAENVILNLIIENGGAHNRTAMFKEVQISPVTREYLHVDFYEVSLEKEITVKVQVEPVGKCKGVENGGFLQLIRHELDVSCLPGDIPSKIEVDVSHLDIGDSLHVEEIDPGEKVTLLYDNNFTVVAVAAPTVEEEEVAEEELEEAEEIPAEAEAEEETANK